MAKRVIYCLHDYVFMALVYAKIRSMRAFLAVVILFCTVSFSQQSSNLHPAENNKQEANKAQDGACLQCQMKEQSNRIKQEQEDVASEKRLYHRYMLATIVGVALNCFTICILIWQNILTRKSANAAKASADALKNAERAWVLIRIDYDSAMFNFRFVVHGNTAAKIIRRDIQRLIIKNINEIKPAPEYNFNQPTPVSIFVKGDEDYIDRDFEVLHNLQPEPWNSIRKEELLLVVYGIVEYRDVIDESPHETRFCYQFNAAKMKFSLSGPEQYNKHT